MGYEWHFDVLGEGNLEFLLGGLGLDILDGGLGDNILIQ